MVSYLGGASPWIRFMGILGYIGCAVMAVGGIGWITIVPFFVDWSGDTDGPVLISFGLVYAAAAVLLFFPSLFTYNYGTRLRNFLRSNSERELELAFKYNRSLWKFMGIMTIINLVLVPLAIVIGIILAVSYRLF
jgi:hypothetical protein